MANQQVNIVIRALDKTKKGFLSATKGLKAITGSVLNMKTAIVGAVGAGGFGALIQSSINAGDELAKTADKLGVTTEALSGLRHAAELTGVSTGTMDMALQRFTRRAAEAANGTGEAKGALRELGIDAESIVRLPLDEQMNIVAEAMSGVETQSDRVRLAMKLFDSEGVALVNTLGGGADALKAMTEEAEHLGLTLSRTDTAQMEAANDAITRLKGVFEGLTNQLGLAFAPIITFVADAFRQAALDSAEFGNIGQAVANGVIRSFGFVRNVLHEIQIFFLQAKLGAMEFANAIGSRLIPFLQNFIDVYNQIASVTPFLDPIKRSADEIMGSLPAGIRATREEIAQLKTMNPGGALVADMQGFIVASREAAESVAAIQSAAIGAAGADISAPNFVDRLNESFTKLQENLPTVQQQIDSLAKTTMKNMSDSLMGVVKGTVKLKDAFKQMAASLIMQAIQLFVIDKITGGFLSFAKGLTGKAIGGPVQSGQPYMVGERGPEMFVPNQSGSIIPNKKMGGGVTVINNVDARGSGADVDQKIKFAMAQSSQQTIMTIQDLMRRRRFV